MLNTMKKFAVLALFMSFIFASTAAFAGTAHILGFQEPTGVIAEEVNSLYNFIFYITAVIFLIVQVAILYSIWRFRRSKNKNSATFTHNTPLEIVWMTIPAIICVVIAWKSFQAMHFIRSMPSDGLDVEVIAFQFGWDFDYPDLDISSPEMDIAEAKKTEKWLAELTKYNDGFTVKEVVVPTNTNVRLHVTSKDVIHAFYVPQLILKIDAIPGRINYQWFNVPTEGVYIGQCAELCGAAHGQMYFAVRALSPENYTTWVNEQRTEAGLEALTWEQIEEAAK